MVERVHAIAMPKLGLSMTEGMVAEWHVAPGAKVTAGALIADIETSKITNDLEVHVTGTVKRLLVEIGEEVPVGELIAVIADEDVSDAEIEEFIGSYIKADADAEPVATQADGSEVTSPADVQTRSAEPPASGAGDRAHDALHGEYSREAVFATHHAHKLAERLGIDLTAVTGSGRRGRISRRDVEEAVTAAGGQVPEIKRARSTGVSNDGREQPIGAMRRTIASRLAESKRAAPHFRLSIDIRADGLLDLRRDLLHEVKQARISVNDVLVKGLAMALTRHPGINVQFDGDRLLEFPHADVAVAVALDAGLITPIVRSADVKGVSQIATELAELVARARRGDLQPHEFEGGTFTLSNLGMFGVRAFDAIINPPQVAILAIGTAERRAFVTADDSVAVGTFITATMSCDHRVIDGVMGARFLESLKGILEQPGKLLL